MGTNYFKEFLKYGSLNVMGMIGLSCYILADTFFISKGLGATGLTALNLAIPIYSIIHGCGLMLGMGGAIKYTVFKSQGNDNAGNHVFTNTLYLAGLLSVFFFSLGLFLSNRLTTLVGADPQVFHMTQIYLKIILLFSPAFILNNILICFVRNDGNPQRSMAAMLGGSLSNILLDYIFIFPLRMGMFGAVFATGLAPIISMIILCPYFVKKRNGFIPKWTPFSMKISGNIFALGFSNFITELSSGIVILVFNYIILEIEGNIGIAAYGVIANLSLVVLSIFTGLSQGMQPLISNAYGRGEGGAVTKVLRYGLYSMAIIAIMLYIAVLLLAEPLAQIFNSENHTQLQQIAVLGLRIYFTGIVFAGYNILLATYFTSTEKPFPAQFITLSRGLIFIVPLAFLLSTWLKMTGIWLTFPVTEGIVAVMAFVTYKNIKHRKK